MVPEPATLPAPSGPALDPGLEHRIASRAAAADRGERDLAADLDDLADCGLIAAPVPVDAGGAGLGTSAGGARACADVLRLLGRANLSLARLFEGHVNAVKLVVLYGTPIQQARVFKAVLGGRTLGVWGADAAVPVSIEATAGGEVLRGGKRFTSGLGLIGEAVVSVAGENGPQLLLLPVDRSDRADSSSWRVSGMRATLSGTYDFDGVPLSPAARLGEPGDYFREPHFQGGVWRYCAAHLGGAEALYHGMLHHLRVTDRSEDPHQQARIAEVALACETARLWIEQAAMRVEDADAGEDAAIYALLAREATERACIEVLTVVERALGTVAYCEGHPVERVRRDLGLFIRQAAPDAKRAAIARHLAARSVRAEAL